MRGLHRLSTWSIVVMWLGACLVVGAASVSLDARQPGPDIAVVVHQDVAIENLSTADLRRILLGDREFWPSGERVALLIRAPVARERDVVVSLLCRMTEAQFRQHWIAKVFRNESPSGPRIVYSATSALDQAIRTAGAIAFVTASEVGPGVKVVRIDGRKPGEPGYSIR